MTAQQAAFLRNARLLALNRAGLSVGVDETPSLSHADRNKYLSALADIILEYPDRFDAQTIKSATLAKGLNFGPLETYGIGDAFADFGAEFAAQGQALNPLSEQNRSGTLKLITFVGLVAAAVYFGVLAIRTSPRRNA